MRFCVVFWVSVGPRSLGPLLLLLEQVVIMDVDDCKDGYEDDIEDEGGNSESKMDGSYGAADGNDPIGCDADNDGDDVQMCEFKPTNGKSVGKKVKGQASDAQESTELTYVPATCALVANNEDVFYELDKLQYQLVENYSIPVIRNKAQHAIVDEYGRIRLNARDLSHFRLDQNGGAQYVRQVHLMKTVREILRKDSPITGRALYYLYNHGAATRHLFNYNQQVIQTVRHLANNIGLPIRLLGINSGSCGLFAGDCILRRGKHIVYYGLPSVLSLTYQNIGLVLGMDIYLRAHVHYLLLFETEGYMTHALKYKFVRENCLVFASRGFADHLTRCLVRSLVDTFHRWGVTLHVFTDLDAFGVAIAMNVLYGGCMSIESYLYSIVEGSYCGILPADIEKFELDEGNLSMSQEKDRKKALTTLAALDRRWKQDAWRKRGTQWKRDHLIEEHKKLEATLKWIIDKKQNMPLETLMQRVFFDL